jgi:hypothetical protein
MAFVLMRPFMICGARRKEYGGWQIRLEILRHCVLEFDLYPEDITGEIRETIKKEQEERAERKARQMSAPPPFGIGSVADMLRDRRFYQ